ncbi:MAG: efflux RND transporter periplasmic adaptor subunit [Muribaculum sp.]|nr:efflux RND transporter periplasmic adaptor subunit [Muribaculum sp.]
MRNSVILKAVVSISALALVACGGKKKTGASEGLETVDVTLPVVDSVLLTNTYPGYLTANKAVDVVGRVNGQLMSQNYKNGDMVKAGATLFTIESTSYRDAVRQAEAELATAKSTRDYAASHYEAVKKALESDAVSKMEVIQAESNLKQAEASIKNAEAALATARKNLSYCTVVAPYTGEVSQSKYDVGSYIGGEAQPIVLAQIFDNSVMYANFAIDDEQYAELYKAMEDENLDLSNVPVEFEDTMSHRYTGKLSYIAPSINQSTGTMTVKCSIQNPYNELKAGMFVKIKLPYSSKSNAILVKDSSIGSDQLGKYLYIVNDSNKIVYTPITVGDIYKDSMRIVTSGITDKSRYVTKALLKVRDGMPVKPRMTK